MMNYDLFIIGGGINGTGIARDAAGRGLKVGLAERNDLATHTSSSSTKLIHGGLRYLETFEFRLVREALIEREVLLRAAPHIIWPLRFVLPHHKGLRPVWLLRLGLFIYDHLGGRKILPPTRRVGLHAYPYTAQLKPEFRLGFEYSDCWVEDSRLVVLNAMDARERGADVFTRSECIGTERQKDHWTLQLKNNGQIRSVQARVVVNAGGPWVEELDRQFAPGANKSSLRLIKGSHIVTRRLYDGDHAYIFQNTDNRIVFAIPYEQDFTLIGTTDVPVARVEDGQAITSEEVTYLCRLASDYFKTPVTADDVVWSYAGVRPLFDDDAESASKVTRDYTLVLNEDSAPFLSVYGGKITTFRKLAEHALLKLKPHFPNMAAPWTQNAALPGGDMANGAFDAFLAEATARHDWVAPPLLRRLARAYGTRLDDLLSGATGLSDMGSHFGAGLYEKEVRYLMDQEFACSADDVLWRRSKLGLHMTAAERDSLVQWFEAHAAQTG